jgi:hypothetical protein
LVEVKRERKENGGEVRGILDPPFFSFQFGMKGEKEMAWRRSELK